MNLHRLLSYADTLKLLIQQVSLPPEEPSPPDAIYTGQSGYPLSIPNHPEGQYKQTPKPAGVATTMDIYSHVLPDMQEKSALAIDAALAPR
jgi:hypothetical protein